MCWGRGRCMWWYCVLSSSTMNHPRPTETANGEHGSRTVCAQHERKSGGYPRKRCELLFLLQRLRSFHIFQFFRHRITVPNFWVIAVGQQPAWNRLYGPVLCHHGLEDGPKFFLASVTLVITTSTDTGTGAQSTGFARVRDVPLLSPRGTN